MPITSVSELEDMFVETQHKFSSFMVLVRRYRALQNLIKKYPFYLPVPAALRKEFEEIQRKIDQVLKEEIGHVIR